MRGRFASLTCWVAACIAWAAVHGSARADAPAVVLMLDPDRREAMAEALAVDLAGRTVEVLWVDAPAGATPLARAAAAQEGVRFVGGVAAIYVERRPEGATSVRVVGGEGEVIRHAPLPRPWDEVEPRVFALVASSLLEELLGPPEEPVRVRVQVHVDAPGREVTLVDEHPAGAVRGAAGEPVIVGRPDETGAPVAAPPAPPPQPAVPPVAAHQVDSLEEEDLPLLPREGWLVEAGGVFAGVGVGPEVGLAWHPSEALRLGLHTAAVFVFDGSTAYLPSVELARIGGGASARFDFGARLGLVFLDTVVTERLAPDLVATYDVLRVGWMASGFFGWTWELGGVGIGARAALAVAQIEESGPVLMPMITAHLETPL